jgi:hypothetical protein
MKQLLTGCIRDMQLFAKLAVNGMSRLADNVTEVSCPEFHSEMIRHYLKLDQPYLTLDESKNKESLQSIDQQFESPEGAYNSIPLKLRGFFFNN